MTDLNNLKIDYWDIKLNGDLNAVNLENKLKTKYGHRFHKYVFDPSFSLGNHTHEQDKADAILAGKLEMIVVNKENKEEKRFVLEAGDIFYLPANTVHRARVVSNEDCIFYDSFK